MSPAGGAHTWRRARAAVRLGLVGLRVRRGYALLVACGVVTSTALLLGILGGGLLARDRALRDALAHLPAPERALRVDTFGLPVQQPFAADDRAARAALASLGANDPIRVSFFHDALVDGQLVRLVAVDGLSRFVTLRRGRLPRACTARSCEVLQVGARGRPSLREGGLALERTGVARIRDPGSLGPAFQGLHTYGTQEGVRSPIVLLTPSTAAVERVPVLRLFFRVRSWIAPRWVSGVRAWEVDALLAREARAQQALHDVDGAFKLDAPDDALLSARELGTVSARRLVLLGASSSALLLGFVLVAATGLSRGLASERRRLLQHGATRWQARTAAAVSVGMVTFLASVLGAALGALVVAALASALDVPVGAAIRHSLLEREAVLGVALTWALATVIVLAASGSPADPRARRRVQALDVAALGAAVAVVVGVRHEGLDPERLSGGATPTILILLPLLVCFVGAVAAARLLGPLMQAAERVSRRGPVPLGLALLGLARAPARTAAAGAFLVVAVALAVFAAAYRSTLERGARDEAGFRVPLAATVEQGRSPLFPFGTGSPLGVAGTHPVLRRSATTASLGTSAQGVTVLGVPEEALRRMYWRADFSLVSRGRLVEGVIAPEPVSLVGNPLPPGATRVTADVLLRGEPLRVALSVADRRGVVRTVPMGRAGRGESRLTALLPRAGGRLRVTGIELSLTRNGTDWFFHLDQEGRLIRPPDGALELRALRAEGAGRDVALDPSGWVVRGPGGRVVATRPVRVSYTFDEARTIALRPPQPTDGRALAVIASPAVARVADPGGRVVLDFGGLAVPARVVGVSRRFPTIAESEPFVVAEEGWLRTRLDADLPGAGTPDEAWLDGRPRPVAGAAVAVRSAILARLERDPLARATGDVLGVTALLSLGLAAVGVWLTLLSGLHDERRDLVDLEAQGAAPEQLRSYLRLRSLLLVAFGIVGGVALGLVLGRLVVSLVHVSAGSSLAQPPLVLASDWARAGAALAVFVLVVGLALELSLRAAFRRPTPARDVWSLE